MIWIYGYGRVVYFEWNRSLLDRLDLVVEELSLVVLGR